MTQKSIFITGAGSGIGLATAQHFARAGWRVGAYDLDDASVNQLVDEFGDERILAGAIDVTDDASVATAISQFSDATNGRMDVLFNSAGVLQIGRFAEVSLAKHLQHLQVNTGGIMRVSLAAMPLLKSTSNSRLINMSSASADYGAPDFASYSASKFAVRGLTEALNLEWREWDIHVCDIMPPFVRTAMLAQTPDNVASLDRLGIKLSAQDIAKVAWKAATGRRKVHWPVGLQYKLLYYSGQISPHWLRRSIISLLTGQ